MWKDGAPIVDDTGPNGCTDGDGKAPCFTFGLSEWPWQQSPDEAPSVVQVRRLSFDEIRSGDGAASCEAVSPPQGGSPVRSPARTRYDRETLSGPGSAMTARRPLVAGVVALCCLLLAVGASTGCSTWRAGRVLRDTLAGPRAVAGDVAETRADVATRAGALAVTVYRPKDASGPLPAFLLVHGATAAGAADPRLVALARALAARGATVATPDVPSLASLTLHAAEPGRLADVALWLGERADLAAGGRVALAGISVGGSYVLIAALDARLEPRVQAVFAFGAYADLRSLVLEWLTVPAVVPELLDPSTEGRRRVLLGNLDTLVETAARPVVAELIGALLEGRAAPVPAGLGPRATRVVRAARSERPIAPQEAEALVAPLADAFAALSPAAVAGAPGARVYLLHAESDPVVALEHGRALHDLLRGRGGDVRLHATRLFGHVDAASSPSLLESWPLLRFFAGFLDASGL